MRCSLRQGDAGRPAGESARGASTLRFQFEEPALQRRRVQELFREGVAHASDDGWLVYREAHAGQFERCARLTIAASHNIYVIPE